jgi:quinoprotein glucose dehydrogenase
VKVGDKELTWKAHEASDYFFDLNAVAGDVTENAVAYAVAYVTAPEEMKAVQLRIGSDDDCKVYLNGKEVIKVVEDRPLDKDQNDAEVTLNKGTNTLVLKVVNGVQDWSGCARFTDKNGNPVTNVTVALVPPAGN